MDIRFALQIGQANTVKSKLQIFAIKYTFFVGLSHEAAASAGKIYRDRNNATPKMQPHPSVIVPHTLAKRMPMLAFDLDMNVQKFWFVSQHPNLGHQVRFLRFAQIEIEPLLLIPPLDRVQAQPRLDIWKKEIQEFGQERA